MTTVVIPAHNEGRVIRRLLEPLIKGADPGEMDIIVVANGCTDDTAEAAASFGPAVRVLTLGGRLRSAQGQPILARGDYQTWLRDESNPPPPPRGRPVGRAAVRSQARRPRRAPPAGGPGPCPAHQVIHRRPSTQRCGLQTIMRWTLASA